MKGEQIMKKLLLTLLAVGMTAAVSAQTPPPPPKDGPCPGMECRKGKMPPHHHKKFAEYAKSMELLKQKYAKEMEEISVLRKDAMSKMAAANEKLAELAKKENLDLPCVRHAEMRQKMEEHKQKMDAFKAKYAKELKEIEDARNAAKEAGKKYHELLKKEGLDKPFFGPRPGCKGPGPAAKKPAPAPAK